MNLSLFSTQTPRNYLIKSLTSLTETALNVILKDNTDIIDPSFILSSVDAGIITGCNYVYSEDLKRYYFVNGINFIRNGVYELVCHVDVLMTYAQQIKEQTAIIHRQENNWNLYLDDGIFKTYQNPYIVTKKFPSGFTNQSFILAVAGD